MTGLLRVKKKISVRARWGAVTMIGEKTMINPPVFEEAEKRNKFFFLLILLSRLLKLHFKLSLTFTFRGS